MLAEPARTYVALIGYDALKARLNRLGHVDARLLTLLGKQTVHEAKARAPHRTGNLQHTIVSGLKDAHTVQVTARASYAAYVELGTGLYGPKHEKITPKAKLAMRWMGGPSSAFRLTGSVRSGKAGAGAGYIYARSTKGMRPRPYLLPGAQAAIKGTGLVDEIYAVWEGKE